MGRIAIVIAAIGFGVLGLAIAHGESESRSASSDEPRANDDRASRVAEHVDVGSPVGGQPATRYSASVYVVLEWILVGNPRLRWGSDSIGSSAGVPGRSEVGEIGASFGLMNATFSWDDIGLLLLYADDQQPSRYLPGHPESSASVESATVGTVVLWLIEGIRCGAQRPFDPTQPDPTAIRFRFPSLDPYLVDSRPASARRTPQQLASDRYHLWWWEAEALGPAVPGTLPPLAESGITWF